MKRLLEKLPLVLLSICAFAHTGLDMAPIAILLVAVSVSLTVQYLSAACRSRADIVCLSSGVLCNAVYTIR